MGQGGCLSRAMTILGIEIRDKVKTWKEKSLIGKFVGVWPRERNLVRWIQGTWKLKGHYDLHLGSKGFFMITFFNQEDRDRVLEGGPYFFFSAGLLEGQNLARRGGGPQQAPILSRFWKKAT